jgi:predicted enzyme related to lactoylglutathione lyase
MPISSTPGAPIWVELFTPDQDAAAAFYGDLFGWTAEKAGEEYGNYLTFHHGDGPIAGCMTNDGSGPNAWSVYLQTEDVDATVEKAKDVGANVVVEPMQVGEMGKMAFLVDPGGAAVGAWQPLSMQGISARGEVGAPGWFEVLTHDYPKTIAFYTDVFGWQPQTMSDTADFRYTTLGEGEAAEAGIMDADGFLGEQPSHWQFYVQVADTDATVAQAVASGAELIMPIDDTPYGRLGALIDPAGVPFMVMGPGSAQA